MHLPRSAALVDSGIISRLETLEECRSTNTELVAKAHSAGDLAVLVTDNQTGGRGRLGRVWVAPPGETIAISVLLRPRLPSGIPLAIERFGWLPLIAGIAMTRAIAPLIPAHSVALKWPNDVQIDGQKVSGLLAELLPGGAAVVMGAGVNLTIDADGLPTATSTSLLLNDPTVSRESLADAVLAGFLTQFTALYRRFLAESADAAASGIAAMLTDLCSTLGQEVRVQLPGGTDLVGTAVSIDESGRLEVRESSDGPIVAVAAGDVTHLRYE